MAQLSPNLKYDHAFAIIRIDSFHHHDAAPEVTINVKKVVRSQEFAELEVARLNALKSGKGSRYFWQVTRLERAEERPERTASASDSSTSAATTTTGD